ncbi:flagellar assembly protein T N-terminal domain-containing protein [Catenovulum sp. SM1970]|uniref:flagella assembly protein FlgT n=1 Tax=Marinifaba aquimaris TaxID=2741323 RepID=UPI0015721B41|nr:flagella assembly protein FlgT [Marinifaba aquimaris]NTS75413.1 flagellar assembly protein T N-terminal domain-containing protein [Marinifaba aquimaris]
MCKLLIKTIKAYASFFTLLCTLVALPTHAGWYQATGVANIYKGDIDKARKAAIKDAVRDALLFSGAAVTSAQQVTNGLLTQDMFEVRASGVVNDIELISEKIQGDEIKIVLRADIFAEERQCSSADYRKPLSVAQFKLKNQYQAKVGELYDLDKAIGQRLFKLLKSDSQEVEARTYIDHKMALASQDLMKRTENSTQLLSLANQSDTQYLITASLDDISIDNEHPSFWQTPTRFFEMNVFVYNTFSGENIAQFEYASEAEWDFDLKKQVDLQSRRFWQSNYGQMVAEQINRAFSDIENLMHCQSVEAKIVSVDGYQLGLNLGKNNGIKTGDKFRILHQSSFIDKQGRARPQFIISPYEVEVTQAYQQNSFAKTPTERLLGSVQVGDIIRQSEFALDIQ